MFKCLVDQFVQKVSNIHGNGLRTGVFRIIGSGSSQVLHMGLCCQQNGDIVVDTQDPGDLSFGIANVNGTGF